MGGTTDTPDRSAPEDLVLRQAAAETGTRPLAPAGLLRQLLTGPSTVTETPMLGTIFGLPVVGFIARAASYLLIKGRTHRSTGSE
jgi:hypothetical protein